MESNRNNSKIQLEINNLIDDAVNNAVARRNPVEDSEDALQSLSNEEIANVAGGIGLKYPIIVGLIALPLEA
ncbi:hypothetical protein [Nostoc sp. UHCC 0252]|uniref:hypothetical protein n=1 Tax=Nostoc sp. UHCC 0252 TaxID=3110241 RepID=UPI002B203DD9|nr:hypothetical protein [Nostoc sp. UHCC 0252]MEA5603407.1 hypothetical protein [Nostoc sp. UHCC 0252]